ncbi:MAG TPA: phosphate acyltransferase PlsX [Caulobacteraceae bacterium]|nr:phosphate acyltransferase PlsX [Caulobacteraceae bacterium]
MPDPLVISVDAMGGDQGPEVVIPALALAAKRSPSVRFLVHGEPGAIESALGRSAASRACCEVRPADSVIAMDAKPAFAMRRGKGSSMWNAVESVRAGEASAAISAGNTGALMAISRLLLRMTAGMDRPALAASWPNQMGVSTVLDVGANISCDAERLVEFAIMGAAFHRATYGVARPTVGLLNVGTEHEKGHDEVKGADRLLREASLPLEYRGFVEGDDLAKGTVDVVVTDGFTGNVALKTAEGLARFFRSQLRAAFTAGPLARIGALMASGSLRAMSRRMDPNAVNGGPFLGLNGLVVKSHGGTDAVGFANAVRLAIALAEGDFVGEVTRGLGARSSPASPNQEERHLA